MPVYGIDVSHFQAGMSMASVKKQGYQFVIAKATEGRSFRDPQYPHFRDDCHEAGLLFAAYHFLRSDVPIGDQCANLAKAIGDRSIPVAIDCEPTGAGYTSRPNLAHCSAFAQGCRSYGMKCTLLYYPKFWWNQTGKPNLLGWNLWQALYGDNNHGLGSTLYPGDNHSRWAEMGGVKPAILQFGSNARIEGHNGVVDVDAYRGDLQSLRARHWFTDWTADPVIIAPPKAKPTKAKPAPKPKKIPPTYVTVHRWPLANSSLSAIGKKYGVTLGRLMALNPGIHDANKIYPGQRIRVR